MMYFAQTILKYLIDLAHSEDSFLLIVLLLSHMILVLRIKQDWNLILMVTLEWIHCLI